MCDRAAVRAGPAGVILVVDDPAGTGRRMRDLLQQRGHAAHACAHPRDALQVLQTIRPAAVVLGEQLAPADAMTVLLALRRGRPELAAVPIVVPAPTAVDDADGAARSTSGGAACYGSGWRAEAIRLGGYVLCGVGVGLQVVSALESALGAVVGTA